MAESKPAFAADSDAEVVLVASEDEAPQQKVIPELLNALVKQVEFYFSDANLTTDVALLKRIRQESEGYVPVKRIANFRKVRMLSKDIGIVTEALRGATLLELTADAKRVRRIVPVPQHDVADSQKRTIVVGNLPGYASPTIESVTEMFRMYGSVKLVRICTRESKGKLPGWLTSSCQSMAGQLHAYVEFEEEEGAVLASAALAAEGDASDGTVQVRRLLSCIAEHRERGSWCRSAEDDAATTTSAAAVAAALAPMARAAPIAPKFYGVGCRSAAGTVPALEGAFSSPLHKTQVIGAAADVTAVASTDGLARTGGGLSTGGIASTTAWRPSFGGAMASSISDGGVTAWRAHTSAPHAPSRLVARGPDSSLGFSGRRSLAVCWKGPEGAPWVW